MLKRKLTFAAVLSLAVSGVNANAVPVADLETFFGASIANLGLSDGVFNQAGTEGSGIKSSFDFVAGDVLSFDYRFLTDEHDLKPNEWLNDYAFFVLDGAASVFNTVEPLFSTFGPSATPYIDELPLLSHSTQIGNGGLLDFGIGIVDQDDRDVSSALLIDNITVTRNDSVFLLESFEEWSGSAAGDYELVSTYFGHAPTEGEMQMLISTSPDGPSEVPVPAAFWLFGSGLIGLVGVARRKKT